MKNLLLFAALLVFGVSNAQFIIWEDEFDGAQAEPWTFYSLDENPYTWNTGKNCVFTGSSMVDGTLDVLYYRTYNSTGTYNISAPQEDWAVSPMIDLTGASGIITLAINFQDDLINKVNTLPVYISTTPDVQIIKDSQPFETLSFTKPGFVVLFTEKTLDISKFAGQQIYIAFGKKSSVGSSVAGTSEIDYINIISDTELSVNDINASKTLTQIVQNPVVSTLQLQLNPAFDPTTTFVKVYNMLGQEVLATTYNNQIEVSALVAGTYIVHIKNGSAVEKLKFIKK